MSGAIFQGLVRNPLVSPDIIGIDAGASLFAVVWIVTGQRPALLPLVAFAGAVAAAAADLPAHLEGRHRRSRLILVGIGVNAAARRRDDLPDRPLPDRAASARPCSGRPARSTAATGATCASLAIALARPGCRSRSLLMWSLRVLQLGDDTARGLGMPLERTRLGLIARRLRALGRGRRRSPARSASSR